MNDSTLLAAATSALSWLASSVPTAAHRSAAQPAEKDIADAAVVLEVVSRTPRLNDVARALLLLLWQQPATHRALREAQSRDPASQLRSLLAFSGFLRGAIIDERAPEELINFGRTFCPTAPLDSLALAHCRVAVQGLRDRSQAPAAGYRMAADMLLPLPVVPSIETAYLFTHAVFYLTDFGNFTCVVPPHDVEHISARMPLWMEHFFSLPEFDVYAELSAVATILGLPSALDWACRLFSAQLHSGVLPGSPYDDDGFHSTLVALLAWALALRGADAEPRAAQPGNAPDGAARRG